MAKTPAKSPTPDKSKEEKKEKEQKDKEKKAKKKKKGDKKEKDKEKTEKDTTMGKDLKAESKETEPKDQQKGKHRHRSGHRRKEKEGKGSVESKETESKDKHKHGHRHREKGDKKKSRAKEETKSKSKKDKNAYFTNPEDLKKANTNDTNEASDEEVEGDTEKGKKMDDLWMECTEDMSVPMMAVKALNRPLVVEGQGKTEEHYVALWYRHGLPVFGRIFDNQGKMAVNFTRDQIMQKQNVGRFQVSRF